MARGRSVGNGAGRRAAVGGGVPRGVADAAGGGGTRGPPARQRPRTGHHRRTVIVPPKPFRPCASAPQAYHAPVAVRSRALNAPTPPATDCPSTARRPGRRLRRPVRPAHRPPGARGPRLHRDRPPHDHRGRARCAQSPRGARSSPAGPASVHADGAPSIDPAIYEPACPSWASATAPSSSPSSLGGEVAKTGRRRVRPHRRSTSPAPREPAARRRRRPSTVVWMSHFDTITGAARRLRRARVDADGTPAAAFEDAEPRGSTASSSTPRSCTRRTARSVLRAVPLRAPAGCRPTWTHGVDHRRSRSQRDPHPGRQRPGRSARLSGGVDSAVAAALVHKAIGPQLTCVLRRHRAACARARATRSIETFRRNIGIELIHVRAADRFFERLDGRHRPRGQAQGHRRAGSSGSSRSAPARHRATPTFLVQGTLYPDVIESGGTAGTADVIKSHHNVGGLPEDMQSRAGRAAARPVQGRGPRGSATSSACPRRSCGASRSPARASASRIIGEVTPEKVATAPATPTSSSARRSPRPASSARSGSAFAVLADIRVRRRHGRRAHLRPRRSSCGPSRHEDAMTADWARLPYEVLERMSRPHHQRGRRRQPGRLRHHVEAAGHHRVGVSDPHLAWLSR